MKTPETISKAKRLALEIAHVLGVPHLTGHLELNYKGGDPKDVTIVDKSMKLEDAEPKLKNA